MGTRALSLGVKRPGREADHSPPSSDEVKNVWSYTPVPIVRLRSVVLSWKHRDNFTFILPLPLPLYYNLHMFCVSIFYIIWISIFEASLTIPSMLCKRYLAYK
jgi:hypothetical protein